MNEVLQRLQPWLGAFSIFCHYFSILMAISVFFNMTSNKHRWSKKSPKRPFFFLLTRCIRAYSVLFGIATSPTINFLACRSSFKLHSSVSTQAGQLERAIYDILTRKMVPITGRASSFLVFFFEFSRPK